MKNNAIAYTLVALTGGIGLTFFFQRQFDWPTALTLGTIYAFFWLILVIPLHKILSRKLSAFSSLQQWILGVALYISSISLAYIFGFVAQIFITMPASEVEYRLSRGFWEFFSLLFSLMFDKNVNIDMVAPGLRSLITGFVYLLVLLSLAGMLISFIELKWRQIQKDKALNKARLTALQAQIEPHFLFNSLNTIAAMIKPNPAKAEDLLLQLSDILRFVFRRSGKELISIAEEMAFSRQYGNLLQARFEPHLTVHFEDQTMARSIAVPALIIQPLIENAVNHGWKDKTRPLRVDVNTIYGESQLKVVVADNGSGFTTDPQTALKRTDHALGNIGERVRRHGGSIRITSNGGCKVSIELPLIRVNEEDHV
jgi:sensor histidine kinase YesM